MKSRHLSGLVLRWARVNPLFYGLGIFLSSFCSSCGPIPTNTFSSKDTSANPSSTSTKTSLSATSKGYASAGSCDIEFFSCVDYTYYSGSLATAQIAAAASCKKGGLHGLPACAGTYKTKSCDRASDLNGYCDFYSETFSGVLLKSVAVYNREIDDAGATYNCRRVGGLYSKTLPKLEL